MELLCIAGPRARERIPLYNPMQTHCSVPILQKLPKGLGDETFNEFVYERMQLGVEGRDEPINLWVPCGWTHTQVVLWLLKDYEYSPFTPPRKP